jgi:hypothetical protein
VFFRAQHPCAGICVPGVRRALHHSTGGAAHRLCRRRVPLRELRLRAALQPGWRGRWRRGRAATTPESRQITAGALCPVLSQFQKVLLEMDLEKSSISRRQEGYNVPAARLHFSSASTVFFPREGIVFASSVVCLSPKLISAGALRRFVAVVPAVRFTVIHREDNVCQRCIDST